MIYRFNAICIKIPMVFSTEIEKKIPKTYMKSQKTLNSQNNLKYNKAGEITLPDFNILYKATVIKTVWYWHNKRHYGPMEQNGELLK